MKIIIADDEYANRLLISEIVTELGHEIIEVENGELALSALKHHHDVDLILMDIEMPIMNGVEAAKQIRACFTYPENKVPIIAITGHHQRDFNGERQYSCFNGFLTKPYSIEKIIQLIDQYSL